MSDSLRPHEPQHASPPCPSPTPGVTQTHVHWVGDVIQPSHPLSSPSPPALNLSQHQGFSDESALCIWWPKYWRFSFNISPSNEHPGLISFRMDWLDLLAVQGILKGLLQHHSSKASILWRSAFFIVQLLHPYMTTEKPLPSLDGEGQLVLILSLHQIPIDFHGKKNTSVRLIHPPVPYLPMYKMLC